MYNPFEFGKVPQVEPKPKDPKEPAKHEEYDYDDQRGISGDDALDVTIPDMEMTKEYNMFFGRLVIVAPKQVRFTTEICYDCVLIR